MVLSDAQARDVIFETACNMDIIEFCSSMKYHNNAPERRRAFAHRLYKKIRRKYFGGLTKKYILHVLWDIAQTGGPNAVWDFIANKIQGGDSHNKWLKWRDEILVRVKVAMTKAREFANELDEFPLTNAHRGKILGEFATGLQRTIDDEVTPSPFSHEVATPDVVHTPGTVRRLKVTEDAGLVRSSSWHVLLPSRPRNWAMLTRNMVRRHVRSCFAAHTHVYIKKKLHHNTTNGQHNINTIGTNGFESTVT